MGRMMKTQSGSSRWQPIWCFVRTKFVKSHIEDAWKHAESVVNRNSPPEAALAG